MNYGGNPEVREQYFFFLIDKHVLRLDIAVDQLAIMSILDGAGNLGYIGDDEREWKPSSPWMFLP